VLKLKVRPCALAPWRRPRAKSDASIHIAATTGPRCEIFVSCELQPADRTNKVHEGTVFMCSQLTAEPPILLSSDG
jgi:hypothetical protein